MISRIKSRQSRLVIPFDPNRNYRANSVTSSLMVCDTSTLHSDHYNALLDLSQKNLSGLFYNIMPGFNNFFEIA